MDELATQPQNLILTPAAADHLRSLRRWTKFLSVLGFIFLAIMLIVACLLIMQLSYMRNMVLVQVLPLAGVCLIYFFPVYYLWLFSAHSKHALVHADSTSLEKALKYLKLHYTFLGICVLVVIAIYAAIGTSLVVFNNMLNRF